MLSIHQSQYIPWPAFFRKIAVSDIFVILDNVQFQKNGVQNRNKLRNKNGDFWLTIPVSGSHSETILEKSIANDNWRKKHLVSISQSYSKAPFWKSLKDDIEEIINLETDKLNKVNMNFIKYFLEYFEIKTEIILSSSMNLKSSKDELVLDICRKLDTDQYISGLGAKDYLSLEKFNQHAIDIHFLPSLNPTYQQHSGDFIPNLSIIDLMMNESRDFILEYLNGEVEFE